MAVLEIPTRIDISVYSFTIELDGVVYSLVFNYNLRSSHWYFSIYDIDGNPLREGIKLVANWALLLQWVQQGRPDGEMIVANPSNDDDPNRDTFGSQAVLCYDEGGHIGPVV